MTAYVDTLDAAAHSGIGERPARNVAEPAASISQNSVSTLGVGYARAVFDRFASPTACNARRRKQRATRSTARGFTACVSGATRTAIASDRPTTGIPMARSSASIGSSRRGASA